ncbi:MAG: methyltransferase domain-containing protein [Pseudomonadota bacterium]
MLSLQHRQLQPEWMDQPDLDERLHCDALRGLARLNWISYSARTLWQPIFEFAQQRRPSPSRPIRVLDIACGGGDVTVALWHLAAAANLPLSIVACDISQTAIDHAQQLSSERSADICFEKRDVLEDPPQNAFDIVASSLFLHHLTEVQAVALLRSMANATSHLLLINDLLRTRRGYAAAWFACRLLTRSPVVRVDGPRSVAGAYTIPEINGLCGQVPLPNARISRRWPERFLLEWKRENGL